MSAIGMNLFMVLLDVAMYVRNARLDKMNGK